ncbi:hypothetical protein GALMADRAFT_225250 [Galerina marginata CBS 339.88]|uniref:Uncharacterized protein n=1 Tax=Galerina marginata (strain CBS 339.88) TaxID=685588 RepID=A0A067T1Q2_GALM3|nr:hypothetical protein GALMADRAFT_225250 [Galerina marginata CBS 339.88]
MSSRITIARPAVNLKALRLHRISAPRRMGIAANHADHEPAHTSTNDSILDKYEQRMKKILTSCGHSRSLVFISTVVVVSSFFFPAVWVGKAFKRGSSLRSRLPYPFLSTTIVGALFWASVVAFPIITLSASVLAGLIATYARRMSIEIRRLGHVISNRLCHMDAYVANRYALLQMLLENWASDLLDRFEKRGRDHEVNSDALRPDQNNGPLLSAAQDVSKEEPRPEIRRSSEMDMEQGHLPPNPTFQTNKNGVDTIPEPTFFPTIHERDAKVRLLKEIEPDLEIELKRLRLIPAFDAEGWLFISWMVNLTKN